MKKTIAAIMVLTTLAACDNPSDGYYDAAGTFHPASLNRSASHPPLPGGRDIVTGSNGAGIAYENRYNTYPHNTTTVKTYDRAGYYDYNGYYMGRGPNVPRSYLPPRGMCRVWFVDRDYNSQPVVEECTDIQYRVPAGAYVIYGG